MFISGFKLRVYKNVVLLPVCNISLTALDLMTGDVLHEYPALGGDTYGLLVFPGL